MFCLTESFTADDNKKQIMIIAYQDMLKALWSAYKPAYVRPLGFLSEIRKAVQHGPYEMFGAPVPNDSHEFLVYLLDQFHESINTEVPFLEKEVVGTDVEKMRILAENGWNQFVSKNTSEVVKLFFGMMRKTVNCTNCNNNTYQWEMFNSLKNPCEGLTFHEWIQKEVNERSEIEGYRCDHCKGQHLAKKSSHLWRLPPCLFITLHRFHYTGQKIMTPKGEETKEPAKQTGIFNEYNPAQRMSEETSNAAENTRLSELGFDPEKEITVFRGVPTGVKGINPGDWVTANKMLAKDYAGNGDVISMKVKHKHLLTDPSAGEGGYTEEMVYRPVEDKKPK